MTAETVEYHGKQVRRFVSYPEPITDGTMRCGVCGQLDDEEFHDDAICAAVDRSIREFSATASTTVASGTEEG